MTTPSPYFIRQGRVHGTPRRVRHLHSPHKGTRPKATPVDMLVVHCISLPAGHFGTPWVEALFMGTLRAATCPLSLQTLCSLRVSAHLFLDRRGHLTQFVNLDEQAWHTGIACFAGADALNTRSIGIELEGIPHRPFTAQQYEALVAVTATLMRVYPAVRRGRIVGHCDIAPLRKNDPGAGFDWRRYLRAVAASAR